MPIKLSEREKNLAILTLAVFTLYVFLQYLLPPKTNEIERLKDKARNARVELKIAEGKKKILETLEKTSGLIPQRETAVSKEERALEVLKSLSNAITRSKLDLITIKPILDAGTEGTKFNLSCAGSYKNLYDFLMILYKLRTLVLIDALDVTGGGGAKPVLNISMTLTAYY